MVLEVSKVGGDRAIVDTECHPYIAYSHELDRGGRTCG